MLCVLLVGLDLISGVGFMSLLLFADCWLCLVVVGVWLYLYLLIV